MTVTKTALAAAILAVMAVSAQAQQGPTRQIQVLPAPNQIAKAPAIAEPAQARFDGQAPVAEAAPADEAAPAEDTTPQFAPKVVAPKVVAPKFAQKVLVEEPRFVQPKFAPPVRKASYGHGGYGKRNCH